MATKDDVVKFAQEFVTGKKYSYDDTKTRGPGYLTDDKMDCSEFVYQAYHRAGYVMFPPLNSHGMAKMFKTVDEPLKGDIVYWPTGHVAIVKDPYTGAILHAASTASGLREDNYKTGWWASQPKRMFLSYQGA